ncbi:hypothetical protein MRX96_013276 [Rhipicephalus microplus]
MVNSKLLARGKRPGVGSGGEERCWVAGEQSIVSNPGAIEAISQGLRCLLLSNLHCARHSISAAAPFAACPLPVNNKRHWVAAKHPPPSPPQERQ